MPLTNAQAIRIAEIADKAGLPPEALLAFVDVESNGQTSSKVKGVDSPIIRWEGHYFYNLLSKDKAKLKKAVDAGLANPKAGAVANPASQEVRYDMLRRGKAIDPEAAIRSVSWGLGQVMGDHYGNLGFDTPQQLEAQAFTGLEGQVDLMVRFLKWKNLIPALKAGNWAKVASVYNGPAYKTNQYDTKLATAQAAWRVKLPKLVKTYTAPVGIMGPAGVSTVEATVIKTDTGAVVKAITDKDIVMAVQKKLKSLGYTEVNNVDGAIGDMTKGALLSARLDNNLPLIPVIDQDFLDALPKFKKRVALDVKSDQPDAVIEAKNPEVFNPVKKAKNVIAGATATTTVGSAITSAIGTDNISNAIDTVDKAVGVSEKVQAFFGPIPSWLVIAIVSVGLGAGLYYLVHCIGEGFKAKYRRAEIN